MSETGLTNVVLHRNGTIDLMRILFAICIVIHHAYVAGLRMSCGYIGVEFFFIVTGYLAMNKIASMEGNKFEVWPFLLHKMKAFYPEFICAYVIGMIMYTFVQWGGYESPAFFSGEFRFLQYFPNELLLMQIWYFPTFTAAGPSWYLCAMIWGLLMIAPILGKYRKLYGTIIAPLVVIMIYSGMMTNYGNVAGVLQAGGFVSVGLLRGIAGMSLGVISWFVAQKLRTLEFTRTGSILLGCVEWFGYLFVIIYSYHLSKPSVVDFYWIFFLFLSVSISFSGHGWGVNRLSCPLVTKLGKLSLNLYLNHIYVGTCIGILTSSLNYSHHRLELYYAVGVVLATALNCYLSQQLRRNLPRLKSILLKAA